MSDTFEQEMEGVYCESRDVPTDAVAPEAALETAVCAHCGQLRIFLTLTSEEGVRTVHSFDHINGAEFAKALMGAANDCARYGEAFGTPMSLN